MADEGAALPSINRLRSYLRAEMNEAIAGTDLKTNHVPVLTTVNARPGLSVTGLAHAMGIDKSTVTRNVQQLSELGYVEQRGDPCKVNEIYLTEKGVLTAGRLEEAQGEAYRKLLKGFDEGEMRELCTFTSRIERTLSDMGF